MGYKIRGNRIYVTGTVDGKHYRLSTGKEANAINIAWIKKNHRDVLLQLIAKDRPKHHTRFVDFAKECVESNRNTVKPSTHRQYVLMLNKNIVPHFKHYNINEIKPSDIKRWQNVLLDKLSVQSFKNVKNLLGSILQEAVMDEIIDKNPVRLVKSPKKEEAKEISPFTLDEAFTLIGNADRWMKSFLSVAFFTGMRTGEIMGLKWEDVDFNTSKIYVRRTIYRGKIGSPKNGKMRVIDMVESVAIALKEKFKENGLSQEYIFTSRKGTYYHEAVSINVKYWKPLLRRCAIAYRPMYNTRHTFASLMLQNGEDLLWVSQMLGHEKIKTTTDHYIKYIPQENKERATFLTKKEEENRTLFAHQ